MKFDLKHAMGLYAVTDRQWLNGRLLKDDVEKSLIGGVTCLQLREKTTTEALFLEMALTLKELCLQHKIPFIINDNIHVALESDADGLHIGQSDAQLTAARTALGPNKIIGVSVQNVEQAKLAENGGADYLGVGAVFSTSTKHDASTVSHDTLKAICEAVSIPVVAIGGISKENIHQLKGTQVDGVAVVSAIYAQDDITNATKALSHEVKEYLL